MSLRVGRSVENVEAYNILTSIVMRLINLLKFNFVVYFDLLSSLIMISIHLIKCYNKIKLEF